MTGDVYPAGDGYTRRRSLTQVRANMALLAERLSWPDGALETCWDLEQRFPGWLVGWRGENTITGFEHPAGYWATHDGIHDVETFAADPEQLAEQMAAGPPEHDWSRDGCEWCLSHPGNRRVRI